MRKYVILNASEVSNVDFDQVLETSSNCLVYNVGGTKTFVKFEGDTPSFLSGKTEYDHAEILSILEGPEWAGDPEV
jgi:hypothetical protein